VNCVRHFRRTCLLTLIFLASAYAQSKPATVHFYGDGYFGVRHVPLYVDGNKVGTLHGHEVVDVPVAAGKHTVYSGDKKSGIFIEAADGGDYYVKVTLGGTVVLHGQVTLVDPSQGQYEVQARRKAPISEK
jgi:hypothetical protein